MVAEISMVCFVRFVIMKRPLVADQDRLIFLALCPLSFVQTPS